MALIAATDFMRVTGATSGPEYDLDFSDDISTDEQPEGMTSLPFMNTLPNVEEDISSIQHVQGEGVSATTNPGGPDSDDMQWNNVGWKDFNFATGEQEFEVPFLLTVALVGVIGNVLVLVVYLQKKYRASNAVLYIINLAIGDLFILLVVVVFHITEFFPQTWPYLCSTHAQCWLHRFGRFLGFNSTIFTSVAIAYDRFLAVVRPYQFKSQCTTKRTVRNICIVWIAAFFGAIPGAWNFRTKYQEDGFYENYRGKSPFACWVLDLGKVFNDFKIIYMSILMFFVPVAITLVFYSMIIGFMWRNSIKMKANSNLGKARRSHWKTARTLMIVFIAYVACFIMFSTYTIVQQLFLYRVKPMVKNVGLLLPYANSCMNPIVYSLLYAPFRAAVKEIFCKTTGSPKNSKESKEREKNCIQSEEKNNKNEGNQQGVDNGGYGGDQGQCPKARESLSEFRTSLAVSSQDTGSTQDSGVSFDKEEELLDDSSQLNGNGAATNTCPPEGDDGGGDSSSDKNAAILITNTPATDSSESSSAGCSETAGEETSAQKDDANEDGIAERTDKFNHEIVTEQGSEGNHGHDDQKDGPENDACDIDDHETIIIQPV